MWCTLHTCIIALLLGSDLALLAFRDGKEGLAPPPRPSPPLAPPLRARALVALVLTVEAVVEVVWLSSDGGMGGDFDGAAGKIVVVGRDLRRFSGGLLLPAGGCYRNGLSTSFMHEMDRYAIQTTKKRHAPNMEQTQHGFYLRYRPFRWFLWGLFGNRLHQCGWWPWGLNGASRRWGGNGPPFSWRFTL